MSLTQQYQQHVVHMVWSRKRSETLVSMNRLTPAFPSPLLPSTHITYLWWCISGISCSLSEWADWIDVVSLHDPFPLKRERASALKQLWELLLLSRSTFCSKCVYRLEICSWGQPIGALLGTAPSPSSGALYYQNKKGVWVSCSVLNIDRWLPWRWTKRDMRAVISLTGRAFGSHQWWWIIQPLLLR